MSIETHQISKWYGSQQALKDVSIRIEPGLVSGFLGPNGAGKSTLMKILTCYLPPDNGTARVCGFDVEQQQEEVKKKVGYLPEHNPLYPDMYVKEFLEFTAGIHNMKKPGAKINQMIEMTGLGKEQHKKIGALSKGYRQRVGLAQALIHDPEVLILDEPTTGLDPNQLSEIRTLIRELGKSKTVLLSTHIMQEVKAICGRVIIVNQGQIVADSTPDLLEQKSGPSSLVVEFDKPVQLQQLKSLPGVKNVEKTESGQWKLEGNDLMNLRNQIMQFALQRELTLLTLKQEELALEEIFRKLTEK